MTTTIQIDAGTLTASAEDRTVTGLLLPYGEECRSNLGRFTFDAGAVSIPTDHAGMSLNVEHARENVIGQPTSLKETPEGVVATFAIAKTPEGDAALEDIQSGKRKHLSAEVANVIIRAGKGIGGRLFAAALVEQPAFPSATLLAALDTEFPEADETSALTPDDSGDIAIDATETPETVTVTVSDSTTTYTPETKEEDAEMALPNTLTAAASATPRPLSITELNTLYARRAQGFLSDSDFESAIKDENGKTLFGALSDVRYDGTGGIAGTLSGPGIPQWLGEIWNATVYRQQVLPLFAHRDLTSLTFSGFRWTQKPAGGTWAGNKADVNSNTLTVAPVSGSAVRYSIGHDIAREFVDFPVDGFFESYAAAVSEDYARWADTQVTTAAIAGASALAGDALTTLPGAAGGTIGSAMSAIIDGAVAVSLTGTLPNFALVAPALYKQMLKTPSNNILGYLSAALGLAEGDLGGFVIRPSAAVATGKVLVGAREAVTVLELPGAPVRIDALDLARGGVDKAAFGYLAVNVNDNNALKLVTAATA